MTWPDWQNPHCGTSIATHAAFTASAVRPLASSIVVTLRPAIVPTGVTQ